MKYIAYSLLTVFCLSLLACSEPKAQALNQLIGIAEEVSANGDHYSDEDWDAIETSYNEILEEMSQYDYTGEELKEIGRQKAKINVALGKHKAKEIKGAVEDFLDEAQGFVEGLSEELK